MCCVALVHQLESSRLTTVNLCMHVTSNAFEIVCMRYMQANCTVQSHAWLAMHSRKELWQQNTMDLFIRGCVAYSDQKFGHDSVGSVKICPD